MRVAILLVLLALPHSTSAQQCKPSPDDAAIAGIAWTRDSTWVKAGVVGARDSLTLGFASILFPDLGCAGKTDRGGRFALARLPAGTHRFLASQWGVWQLDTIVTLRAGATLQFNPRLVHLPDPLTRVCPQWPGCERLPPDTSLNTAAIRTLWLLSEEDDAGIPRRVGRCLSVVDSARHAVPISGEWLAMGADIYPMSQCTRNETGQFVAPGGLLSTGWYVEQLARKGRQPTSPVWDTKVLYQLGAYYPPLLFSNWSCFFEQVGQGWRAWSCEGGGGMSDH